MRSFYDDTDSDAGLLDLFGAPNKTMTPDISVMKAENLISETSLARSSGFGFSEVMSGFIHVDNGLIGDKKEDYESAANTGKALCEAARLFLSIKAWNTETSKYCKTNCQL
jgi:hypothetical protein